MTNIRFLLLAISHTFSATASSTEESGPYWCAYRLDGSRFFFDHALLYRHLCQERSRLPRSIRAWSREYQRASMTIPVSIIRSGFILHISSCTATISLGNWIMGRPNHAWVMIDVNQVAIEVDFWCKLAEDRQMARKRERDEATRSFILYNRRRSYLQTCGLYVIYRLKIQFRSSITQNSTQYLCEIEGIQTQMKCANYWTNGKNWTSSSECLSI